MVHFLNVNKSFKVKKDEHFCRDVEGEILCIIDGNIKYYSPSLEHLKFLQILVWSLAFTW